MRLGLLVASLFLATPILAQAPAQETGLLVMAHGGSDDWNAAVEQAVAPLRALRPVSVAFGMANPNTLQASVDELVQKGATSIAVVRLFVSGDSFLPETEYAFGLRSEQPEGHFMHPPRQIEVAVPVTISAQGLLDAVALGPHLAERALHLTRDAESESILIVGHGPGDDGENEQWLQKMDVLAQPVREAAPFHRVQVATLREDWTGKRQAAEEEMRAFIEQESVAGREVLVLSFRLHGFGPYAEVFEGTAYRSDGRGFLPDQRITDWIEAEFQKLLTPESAVDGGASSKRESPLQSPHESGHE